MRVVKELCEDLDNRDLRTVWKAMLPLGSLFSGVVKGPLSKSSDSPSQGLEGEMAQRLARRHFLLMTQWEGELQLIFRESKYKYLQGLSLVLCQLRGVNIVL